jgi:hypothetical protein
VTEHLLCKHELDSNSSHTKKIKKKKYHDDLNIYRKAFDIIQNIFR